MFLPTLYSVIRAITLIDILSVLLFSIIGGPILVANQEPETFAEIVMVNGYWTSLLGSSLMAFVVVVIVFLISRYLDRSHPWFTNFWIRFLRQFLSGVVITILITYGLTLGYFKLMDATFSNKEYYRRDFPMVVLLIGMLNLFYTAQYAFRAAPVDVKPKIKDLKIKQNAAPSIYYGIAHSKIAFIYHFGRRNYSVGFDGYVATAKGTIGQLYEGLPAQDFFKFDRKIIVHRSAIGAIVKASSNRRTCLLKTKFYSGIAYESKGKHKVNCVVVSQRQRKAFDKWWLEG